jgi:hypothetical protein
VSGHPYLGWHLEESEYKSRSCSVQEGIQCRQNTRRQSPAGTMPRRATRIWRRRLLTPDYVDRNPFPGMSSDRRCAPGPERVVAASVLIHPIAKARANSPARCLVEAFSESFAL